MEREQAIQEISARLEAESERFLQAGPPYDETVWKYFLLAIRGCAGLQGALSGAREFGTYPRADRAEQADQTHPSKAPGDRAVGVDPTPCTAPGTSEIREITIQIPNSCWKINITARP